MQESVNILFCTVWEDIFYLALILLFTWNGMGIFCMGSIWGRSILYGSILLGPFITDQSDASPFFAQMTRWRILLTPQIPWIYNIFYSFIKMETICVPGSHSNIITSADGDEVLVCLKFLWIRGRLPLVLMNESIYGMRKMILKSELGENNALVFTFAIVI